MSLIVVGYVSFKTFGKIINPLDHTITKKIRCLSNLIRWINEVMNSCTNYRQA